ncbi:FecR family protein [Dyadobacter sp.]|uniref:FecR family protein n=1 Tax=Dyadobacter sp. TaxID=1914288 RepID=UPI0032671EB5
MDNAYDRFQSLDDFLESDRFHAWIKGENPADRAFWEGMLSAYPEKVTLYETATVILLRMNGKSDEVSGEYISEKVRDIVSQVSQPRKAGRIMSIRPWRMVAAAMLLLGLGWLGYLAYSSRTEQKPNIAGQENKGDPWQTRENKNARPLLVNFPDGSSVLLSKGSSVRFETKMNNTSRRVFLEGEGFFEVAKNASWPFFVYTNGLTTKVLGTSFRVRAFAGEAEILVVVKTGKVIVTPGPESETGESEKGVTLLPLQEIRLNKAQEAFVEKQIETAPEVRSAKTLDAMPVLDFRNTPVAEVFNRLEKAYGVPIAYDIEKMRNCTLTATLTDEPFLDKLRLVCLGTESTFEMTDNQVTIHSKGCL